MDNIFAAQLFDLVLVEAHHRLPDKYSASLTKYFVRAARSMLCHRHERVPQCRCASQPLQLIRATDDRLHINRGCATRNTFPHIVKERGKSIRELPWSCVDRLLLERVTIRTEARWIFLWRARLSSEARRMLQTGKD